MARALIDQMTEEWDPTARPNEYRRALEKLLASKRKFALKEVRKAGDDEEGKVVDLMEALRRSVAAGKERRRVSSRRAGAA